MSQIYSAANVVVSSSLYETFGQTLIEAQLCGCIPVAFNNSGQSDIIHHKEDGYLADYLSAGSLADGLEWAFNARIEPRDQKKGVVRRYAESVVAAQYIHLYQEISKKNI
jgi:glycosyltransferase involved in cell wall biosynthesis